MNKRNLEMIADFYEFTMANGYLEKNMNDIAYFDVFSEKFQTMEVLLFLLDWNRL